MKTNDRRMGQIVAAAIALLLAAAFAWWFWKRDPAKSGYPFAAGAPVQAGALWSRSPADLARTTDNDVQRLSQAIDQLDRALGQAQARSSLLTSPSIDNLRAEDRKAIRAVWADLFEPLLALDDIKERYSGFWGIDYKEHPELHARCFGLTYAALCAEVEAGQKLLKLLGDNAVTPKFFDEAMPEEGLPSGSFSAFRKQLGRARDLSYVPAGDGWYHLWIERHLASNEGDRKFGERVNTRARQAKDSLGASAAVNAARNTTEVVKGEAFKRWFPVQKDFSEWAGDTRVVEASRRLISDAQIVDMKKALRSGDVIVERRNWYLSNVGLPGFWPHAALFVGSQQDMKAVFDADPEVQKRFGAFSEHLAKKHPKAWGEFGGKDPQGHSLGILEAVSEGVVASSVEHSLGADYVGAMRPRLALVEIAAAIDKAFGFFGRPYDFNFDFGTDDQVVCSELVYKAYEPAAAGGPGLVIPFITVAGRRVVARTEFVRAFAAERGKETRQFDFVYFLEGREGDKKAVVADEAALAASASRPKWDVIQP